MNFKRHAERLLLVAVLLALGGCAAKSAFHEGNELAAAEDWDRAVYHYSKALSLEPDNLEYRKSLDLAKVKASQHHLQLAKSYSAAGALELAIIEYRVAASLDPTNRFVSDSLENALRRKKELEAPPPGQKSEIEKLKDETRGGGQGPILRPSSQAPLSLNFPPNTKVKDIYVALGKAAGINVLFDSGIRDQETFSIDIANISFKRALDQVAVANKHFYKVIDEKTIMVVPDNPQKRRDFEDHVIKTFYLSNANPNDVVNTLRSLLDARRIATNAALNAITIRDTPAKISVMERVIESNDKPPSEIVIDVEIVEVRKSKDLNFGTSLSTYQVSQFLDQPDSVTAPGGTAQGLRLSNIPYINAADWLLTFPSLTYRAEKNQGNIRTIARPSLRALDGKQVTLRLGEQVPIETSTILGTGVGGTSRNFQFRDIGTNIDITPRVHHNGEVTLQLQVELTNVGADPDGPAGPIPPTFGNRRINTEIRLKDGETNLLAGLFQSSQESSRGGIPILSDLPVLRWILARNSRTESEADIVLTLTPHIVRTPNIQRPDLEPFYVGTESNVGGTSDVSMGATFGGSPFTPPAEGEEAAAPGRQPPAGRPTPPPRPGGAPPSLPTLPGQPSVGGQPAGGSPPSTLSPAPAPTPSPFNPEPSQPSPTGQLPPAAAEPREPAEAVPPTPLPAAGGTPGASPSTTPAAPLAPALVAIVPPAVTTAVDREFSVDVVIEGGSGVSHAPFWILYNPAVLEAIRVVEGPFLKSDGKPTQFLFNTQGDRVVVGLSRVGHVPGIDGSGVLATVVFRSRAAGQSELRFLSSSLRDAASRSLPANYVGGRVTVP